jgi:Cu-Zn family superoxide dismutase
MHPVKFGTALLVLLTLGGATIALAGQGGDRGRDDDDKRGWGHKGKRVGYASLRNAEGDRVGTVWFRSGRDETVVFARVDDLPPGFHGFHVHTTGTCTPPDFMSAGGHLNPAGASHPSHAGDMSTLLVNEDGDGTVALETDRFTVSDLDDADGSAVIVHALPDNYANIPTRYMPQPPDATTLSTGDAGGRLACGVVR